MLVVSGSLEKTVSSIVNQNVTLCFRGLLSEKPDDSLFFLDVGQPKKPEPKGKYAISQLDRNFLGPTVGSWFSQST